MMMLYTPPPSVGIPLAVYLGISLGVAIIDFVNSSAIGVRPDSNLLRRTLRSCGLFFAWPIIGAIKSAKMTGDYFESRFLIDLRELVPKGKATPPSSLPRSSSERGW